MNTDQVSHLCNAYGFLNPIVPTHQNLVQIAQAYNLGLSENRKGKLLLYTSMFAHTLGREAALALLLPSQNSIWSL